jgi:hypothetical protein
MVERCSACQQVIQPQKLIRKCWDCGGQIRTHNKWIVAEREVAKGVIVQQIVHRYCPSPDSYMSVDDYLKQDHHPYMNDSKEVLVVRRARESLAQDKINEWRKNNDR